ncbi:MAG: hypothetical protein EAX95_04395 [Candidatus Thorarchaeota archaeon]|nr:hypothetical protein [Candidatus Thorarchaeota archaeon]
MTERILTQHPTGKEGVNIELDKYTMMRKAILEVLTRVDQIDYMQLREEVKKRLLGDFRGSIGWYYTTVKLDLEARGIIERVPGKKPQIIRLKKKASSPEHS